MAKKRKQKAGAQGDLRQSAHRIWLAGLGALATAEEEGGKLFRSLVERGESFEGRGKKHVGRVQDAIEDRAREARDTAESVWGRVESGLDKSLTTALHKIGVPTRTEIQELTKRVEKLTRSVERIGTGTKPAARRKTAKKKAASAKTARRKTARKATKRKAGRSRARAGS